MRPVGFESIPLDALVNGGIYKIQSRNLDVGVFDSKKRGFVGIREKFGDRYLFMELHYDVDSHYGTAHAKEFLAQYPFEDLTAHYSVKATEPGKYDSYEDNKTLFAFLVPLDDIVKAEKMADCKRKFPNDYARMYPNGDPYTKRVIERKGVIKNEKESEYREESKGSTEELPKT